MFNSGRFGVFYKMTPEQLAKPGTEAAHQMALFCWAALNLERFPELKWLHHIPNGGNRGDTEQSRKIEGGRMKAQGVKKGVLDIFLPVPRLNDRDKYGDPVWIHGLYIEMKKPGQQTAKDGGLSAEQIEFGKFVWNNGYMAAVCYSWEEAAKTIERYLTNV